MTSANRFVDKEEYRRDHNRLTDEINNLRASRDTSAGEKGLLDQFWPLLLALAMLELLGIFGSEART